MRLLQVSVPTGKRRTVLDALDDEGVDYVVTDETSDREYAAIVYAPLPTPAVEPVLERLREVGIDDSAFTVVVEASTVISRRFEELEERYAEEEDEDRIAREELRTRAADLAPTTRTYVVMTIISAVIATAGLLLDSPAVVVGSMVIAPLIGPAMAASVGTVLDDDELFARGVRLQIGGMVLAVLSAATFGVFIRYTNLVPPSLVVTDIPEVRERLAPDFLSLVVALGAGVAGSLSLTAGVSSALVGVMIAVALIPPAATVGIGIAWGRPMVSLGSSVLVMVNILSINFAALLVLWYSGYRPTGWFKLEEARGATIRRVSVLAVAIVLLSVFLGGVTYDAVQGATTEDSIQEAVNETVTATPDVHLLELDVRRGSEVLFGDVDTIVVRVGTTTTDPPPLAERLDAEVERAVGREVDVEVQYVRIERS